MWYSAGTMKAYITSSREFTRITLNYDRLLDSADTRRAIISAFLNAEIRFRDEEQEIIADIICYNPLNFVMADIASLANLSDSPEKRILVAW